MFEENKGQKNEKEIKAEINKRKSVLANKIGDKMRQLLREAKIRKDLKKDVNKDLQKIINKNMHSNFVDMTPERNRILAQIRSKEIMGDVSQQF